LQKDGFIERRVDRNDRRNNRIFRAKRTFEIWETTLECASKVLTIALAGLPDENIQIMKEVLEKMWINLQATLEIPNKTPATIAGMVSRKQGLQETTAAQQQQL
jgi:MarR family transcriptional regulator, transcriptional regulator for hemolysin